MNTTVFEKRKQLRKNLLINLYKHHFEKGGVAFGLDKKVLEDNETKLAYLYLQDKGFIKTATKNGNSSAKITVNGIDAVEKM